MLSYDADGLIELSIGGCGGVMSAGGGGGGDDTGSGAFGVIIPSVLAGAIG